MTPPRWIRMLARPQSRLFELEGERGAAVYPRGDRRRRPLARLGAQQFEAARREGLLVAGDAGWILSSKARDILSDGGDRWQAQHREMESRTVIEADGAFFQAKANRREGPLGRWVGEISASERMAGERFLADYHRSTLTRPVTRNWSPSAPRRGEGRMSGPEEATVAALAAKDRVLDAFDRLGPGMARIVEAVLVREESLAGMERRFGWAQRSGRTAVRLALARLAEIYGIPASPD